jgi:enoyl-CoA hydratase/carnithine racemase
MSAPTDHLVLRETQDGVATLTLNRPDQANALSEAMIQSLHRRIHECAAAPAVRVVVLAARGRIFCGGHDLREMSGRTGKGGFEALFARCSAMMLAIRACPKPVIAKVQGAAVAAGCQLVATCDLAYAADTARFGVSGINLGLFCSTPSVALSRAVPRKQALELLLTGRLIGAARAAEIGLINAAVPAAELDRVTAETAKEIAAKQPPGVALGKDVFYRQLEMDLSGAYALAGERMAENMGFAETRIAIEGFVEGALSGGGTHG